MVVLSTCLQVIVNLTLMGYSLREIGKIVNKLQYILPLTTSEVGNVTMVLQKIYLEE